MIKPLPDGGNKGHTQETNCQAEILHRLAKGRKSRRINNPGNT